MAIGIPTQRYTSAGNEGTTKIFNPATTMAAGTLAVLVCGTGAAGKIATGVTDTVGNTWTVDGTVSGNNQSVSIMSCRVVTPITPSDTITATFVAVGTFWMLTQLLEVAGVASPSAFDKSAGSTSAAGTSISTGPTASLSQPNEIAIVGVYVLAALGWTEGAGYTKIASSDDNSGGIEYRIFWDAGPVTGTGTLGSSGAHAELVSTYKGIPLLGTIGPRVETMRARGVSW